MDTSQENQDYFNGIIPINTAFSLLRFVSLKKIIDSLDFEDLSAFFVKHGVEVGEYPFRPFELIFHRWVDSEIYLDLYACYKQDILPLTGWRQVEGRIHSLFDKFASAVRNRVQTFENDYSNHKNVLDAEYQKILIVAKPKEPIRIPLNIRFAVIKRANGQCEKCNQSIKDHPIEACQLYEKDRKSISFYALCHDCQNTYKDRIIFEQ